LPLESNALAERYVLTRLPADTKDLRVRKGLRRATWNALCGYRPACQSALCKADM